MCVFVCVEMPVIILEMRRERVGSCLEVRILICCVVEVFVCLVIAGGKGVRKNLLLCK